MASGFTARRQARGLACAFSEERAVAIAVRILPCVPGSGTRRPRGETIPMLRAWQTLRARRGTR